MAKSDSFFIRASVNCGDSGTFEQTPIDLGAYVSALGKSVLKIKSVHYEWVCGPDATSNAPGGAPYMDAGKAGEALMQLTTQTQTAMVTLENKSVIAKASLWQEIQMGLITRQQLLTMIHIHHKIMPIPIS